MTISDLAEKIKFIPSFYLLMILYFFLIDIITALALGYQTKDLLFLIDFELVISHTTLMLSLFLIISFIVKKSSFISFLVIFIPLALYYIINNFTISPFFYIVSIVFIVILMLVNERYEKIINYIANSFWIKMFQTFISVLIALFLYSVTKNSIDNWKNFKIDNKIQLTKPIGLNYIFESKSLNPIRLQSLNQSFKVFANPKIINELSKEIFGNNLQNKYSIQIPYDNFIYQDNNIIVNYYDINEIKNVFIINPAHCNKEECKLYTLILKQRHTTDTTQGFNLITKYTHSITISNYSPHPTTSNLYK